MLEMDEVLYEAEKELLPPASTPRPIPEVDFPTQRRSIVLPDVSGLQSDSYMEEDHSTDTAQPDEH